VIYRCCDDNRRLRVRGRDDVNGIDFLEVLDREAPAGSPRQRMLLVRFVNAAPALDETNFAISGGERIDDVEIEWVTRADAPDATLVTPAEAALLAGLPDPDEVLALRTSSSGDYSLYWLHVLASATSLAPPPGIDPLLARVQFSFKVECPSDFDCVPDPDCPSDPGELPAISYLAKDYASFRRLMLDRMAQTIPAWQERNVADLGVALVEMLAYVGDHLSYAQDAVATEGYLGTARRRSSVRRHARFVAYHMHDGSNARCWVQPQIDPQGASVTVTRGDLRFATTVPGFDPVIDPAATGNACQRLLDASPVIFEPMAFGFDAAGARELFPELQDIGFHDWGDGECCLPEGAVRATLRGDLGNLSPGDVLVFEEVLGPRTGNPADADTARRCAVRLVQVVSGLEDIVAQPPEPITEIRWADEDALPFALCISSRTRDGEIVTDVSRARGNILLADHGLSHGDIVLGTVPEPHLWLVGEKCCAQCDEPERRAIPPRYRPALPDAPITQAAALARDPVGGDLLSATRLARQSPSQAVPAISLREDGAVIDTVWHAQRDLLPSDASDRHFVVEVEQDGAARLRFGDDRNARRPDSGTHFLADYRIGNGAAGNVGADAIGHVISGVGELIGVRNPLPATGGVEPESMEAARIAAPQAFRRQERAVTEADYADVARRHPAVQRAAATFRWNGHGHTVFVTLDRFGGRPVTAEFRDEMLAFIEPYRMAGYDLEIDQPRFVPIDLELQVCVDRRHFRAAVRQAILAQLSTGRLADGGYGFFHPDNFSFAQPVYLSAIIARVQAVPGVESVEPLLFERQGVPDPSPLETGILSIGRLEIAQLANDRDFPEHGKLELRLGGGR
jgi:hypothetical protein